jgi:hypothetical protein
LRPRVAQLRDAPLARRAGWFWSAVRSRCEWLERADVKEGPIFRVIVRGEAAEDKALTSQSSNLIVQPRHAGVAPEAFSAQGLRPGI